MLQHRIRFPRRHPTPLPITSAAAAVALVILSGCGSKKDGASSQASAALTPATEPQRDWKADLDPIAQGRRFRMVWAQHAASGGADLDAHSADLLLVGLDSAESAGPRLIVPKRGNFHRPLMRADGSGVVFSDVSGAEPKIFSVAWDGGEPVGLGSGLALQCWRDPATQAEMVYALEKVPPQVEGGPERDRIVRFALATPEEREIIWAHTPVSPDNVQFSRDGRRAAASLPRPEASLINLEDTTSKSLGTGLWPSLAPDDSYVAWSFDTSYGALTFSAPNQKDPWRLSLRALPGMGAQTHAWHPRWSNNPGLITFTAPYAKSPDDPSYADSQDGKSAEIFVARLGADLTAFLNVVQITQNDRADVQPDLWVEGPPIDTLPGFAQQPKELPPVQPKPWPANPNGAAFAWENLSRDIKLPDGNSDRICRLTARKFASFGRNLDLNVSFGVFEADAASNAQIAERCRSSGAFSLEAMITESRGGYDTLSARIFSYRQPGKPDALALFRVNNSLVLRVMLGGPAESPLVYPVAVPFRIDPNRPYHFVATLYGRKLKFYADGALVQETTLEREGLAHWQPGTLELGDAEPFGSQWFGSLEAVALYDRYLPEEEIRQNFEAAKLKMALRKPADRTNLRAKLIEATPLPPPDTWPPYPRILVCCTYEVEQVLAGIYERPRIAVLHWAAMEGKPVPNVPAQIGKSYELSVEPASQHPELKSERMEKGSTDVNLPLYFDVNAPGTSREPKS